MQFEDYFKSVIILLAVHKDENSNVAISRIVFVLLSAEQELIRIGVLGAKGYFSSSR